MGQWGNNLFCGSKHAGIWREYRTLLAFDVSEYEAYNLVKNHYLPKLTEENQECIFWLTMAAVQQGCGTLMQEVKNKALYCIDNSDEALKGLFSHVGDREYGLLDYSMNRDSEKIKDVLYVFEDNDKGGVTKLHYWCCPKVRKACEETIATSKNPLEIKRARNKIRGHKEQLLVLDKLKEKLLAPPLSKKKPSKPSGYLWEKPRWKIGDIVLSHIVSQTDSDKWWFNKYVLYRVADIFKDSVSWILPDLAYAEYVSGALYEWIGDEPPDPSIIKDLDYYTITYNEGMENEVTRSLWTMRWIPQYEKYTLFQRGCEYPMPVISDFAEADGGNIFAVFFDDTDFKALYEHFKSKGQ
ncbi:MAG: hypothetical protein FWE27_01270 [Defluviitaleaceae bacterium]|nr:hypothetical protein [Defluviitaleaceae bacterium]